MDIGNIFATATNGLLQNARIVRESADAIVRNRVPLAPPDPLAEGDNPEMGPDPSTIWIPGESDLITEVFRMKQAEIGYAANAKVISTADNMTKTLLNITS